MGKKAVYEASDIYLLNKIVLQTRLVGNLRDSETFDFVHSTIPSFIWFQIHLIGLACYAILMIMALYFTL